MHKTVYSPEEPCCIFSIWGKGISTNSLAESRKQTPTLLLVILITLSIYKYWQNRTQPSHILIRRPSLPNICILSNLVKPGGADRDRTDDPLLAKQVLSQLSYSPLLQGMLWSRRRRRYEAYFTGSLYRFFFIISSGAISVFREFLNSTLAPVTILGKSNRLEEEDYASCSQVC